MFVLRDGELIQLQQKPFAKEEDFQKLLERYPTLLSGELINPEVPRKWLLVTREIAVPGEQGGGGLWSADHLFLDQDGIPTIVEVKRQSDTRLRREVVGQMLDYAANGVIFWRPEVLRATFESHCAKQGKSPDEEISHAFGPEVDVDAFWQQVKTNLEAQKVRLLFVADEIPRELKTIVEFLNRQMNPAEVLALELKQFADENGLRTLAPSLIGQTEKVRQAKTTGPVRIWSREDVLGTLRDRVGEEVSGAAAQIIDWLEQKTGRPAIYGKGNVDGTATAYFQAGGAKFWPLLVYTTGKLYIGFRDCIKPPFDREELRRAWLDRLNQIPGVSIPVDGTGRQPPISLKVFVNTEARQQLFEVMDWFLSQLPTT